MALLGGPKDQGGQRAVPHAAAPEGTEDVPSPETSDAPDVSTETEQLPP